MVWQEATRGAAARALVLAVPFVAIALTGCSREPAPAAAKPAPAAGETASAAAETASGHRRMLALLEEIARETPDRHPFLNSLKARLLRREARKAEKIELDPLEEWTLRLELGRAELHLGNEERGLRHLTRAYELLDRVDFSKRPRKGRMKSVQDPDTYFANYTRLQLGVGYLRLAETENCCQLNTAESCILPFRGAGRHARPRGARNAIRYFLEVLDNRPGAPDALETIRCEKTALWLLNVAYSALGEYPDGVPEAHRVDLDPFGSEVDFPRFENVAPRLGLDTFSLSGGVIVDDFDGDDDLDVVTSSWDTQGQMKFFRNLGDGSFADHTAEANLVGLFGGLNMVQADYDGDGDTDVLVLRGAWLRDQGRHPNSLLRNDGKGVFTDVTFEAGLGEVHHPTKTAAWADYDNDGDLDLYVGNESTDEAPSPGQLFRNDGDGTFTDVAAEAGLAEHLFAMGCSWGDYDGDRWPDLYVSTGYSDLRDARSGGGPNRLYHNNGDGTFTDVAAELGVEGPSTAFPCWFWDFDNDGHLDLYVACSSGPVAVLVSDVRFDTNRLYRGDGSGGFREVSVERGLVYPAQTMGANFGDLNNDGYLDFYLGTGNLEYSELRPNVMFLNQQGRRFANVTRAGGFGHLQKGHGISFADLDGDGDCDVYAEMGGAWPGDKFEDALFENPGFANHSITIELEGRRSNRSAIGARIRADIVEDGKPRSVYRHVSSGGSFGCNPLRQVVGVGKATSIRRLEVYWPTSDLTQTFTDVEIDRFVRLVEGEDRLVPVGLKRVRLGG